MRPAVRENGWEKHHQYRAGGLHPKKLFTGAINMAMKITDECISCGACVPECPTESITEGDIIYVIDAATCVECVGHHDSPQCVSVCPVECIVKA
jgi:ferredoxin